jgi:hypothetical protein
MVALLLGHGARIEATADFCCDCREIPGILESTAAFGAEFFGIGSDYVYECRPLHFAICGGHYATVELLLNCGDWDEPLKTSAWHSTACHGRSDIVQLLGEHYTRRPAAQQETEELSFGPSYSNPDFTLSALH